MFRSCKHVPSDSEFLFPLLILDLDSAPCFHWSVAPRRSAGRARASSWWGPHISNRKTGKKWKEQTNCWTGNFNVKFSNDLNCSFSSDAARGKKTFSWPQCLAPVQPGLLWTQWCILSRSGKCRFFVPIVSQEWIFAYCIVEYIRSRMLMMQNTMYMNVYDIWKYLKSAAILIPIFDCRHSGLQVWRVQVLQVHLSVSQSALKSSQHQAKHCRTKNHSNDRIHLAKQCQTVWTDWQSVQLYYLISSQSLHIINI